MKKQEYLLILLTILVLLRGFRKRRVDVVVKALKDGEENHVEPGKVGVEAEAEAEAEAEESSKHDRQSPFLAG